MSLCMTKPTKWPVRPGKTQISLGIRPVWSESSLCAQWVAKDPRFLHADAQADLSLHWAHRWFCWFCHAAAQMLCLWNKAFSWKMSVHCRGNYSHISDHLDAIQVAMATAQALSSPKMHHYDELISVEKGLIQNLTDPDAPSVLTQLLHVLWKKDSSDYQ